MKRLAGATELLDGPLDPDALAGNLRDLARVNRWLGGSSLSWRAVRSLLERRAPGEQLRLLDVGTGAADIPRNLRRAAALRDPGLSITATDVRPEIVEIARQMAAGDAELEVKLAGDSRIDEPDSSFDVVHSSMLFHHLEPLAAVAMLREMARVARMAVIVNDLDRGRRWWRLAQVLTRLATGNRYTRHDAPLSVRRAYRPDEIAAFAAQAGLRETSRLWTRPAYRYALVLERV